MLGRFAGIEDISACYTEQWPPYSCGAKSPHMGVFLFNALCCHPVGRSCFSLDTLWHDL